MFTVTGTRNGHAYRAQVGDDINRHGGIRIGCCTGDRVALQALQDANGRMLAATPTAATRKIDVNHPVDALVALYALTDVVDVFGDDVPPVLDTETRGWTD